MVSFLQLLLAAGISLLLAGGVIIIMINRKSYKNKVWIARQTGKDVADVIWIEDRCRVVNKNGAWVIEFQKLREKMQSVRGEWWSKLLKPSYQRKALKFDKNEWDSLNFRPNLIRGLFLYETTEGEFYPMVPSKKDGEFLFKILDQDSKQFMISEIKDVNDLTRNTKQEVTLLWGIVIGIIVLGFVFFAGMWWQGHEHSANLAATAQLCASYTREVINITAGANPNYLNALTGVVGG